MKKRFVILCFTLFALETPASEHLPSGDIGTALSKAQALSKKYGSRRVLFVSDLDNTLLKTNQDLASEPWFNWQDSLLKDPVSDKRIACDIADLLEYFHTTIAISRLSPVHREQAAVLTQMQGMGIPTMILTARGEAVASATFRELTRNGLDFSKTSIGGNGYPETYLPFALNDLADSGLTPKDIERFHPPAPRRVLYQRGVFFADGQNKGLMLRTFLHKTKANIKGVVFFDNDKKNTQRVVDAFEEQGIDVVAIRASTQDADIERFNRSDKEEVTNDFVLLRKSLDQTYLYPRPCPLPIDRRVMAR